ncbi:MAG TPA: Dyp-type peroxidase [Trebonia sp.]|jgi:deferrochelatase/peroxidase EfeB|nr:Dyp-type peroxidase [Trebonia sp.]
MNKKNRITERRETPAVSPQDVTVTRETPSAPQDMADIGGCPAGGFGRRSVLQGVAVAGLAGVGGNLLGRGSLAGRGIRPNEVAVETVVSGNAFPFYGEYQSGIITPPPPYRQQFSTYAAFNVTAANRGELTDLFRTLTARAAFLTAGGAAPSGPAGSPPADSGILGPQISADGLTVTVSVGASLFDGRYGLASRKPAQLVTMEPFRHDDLDPAISDGDLLIQLCADHNDTAVHALLDISDNTSGALQPRWSISGFVNPPRPDGVPRDWFGFKDGIAQPDFTSTAQNNQYVWAQPDSGEPTWAAGGTYHVVRIIDFDVQKWQRVPVAEQERIFGRQKTSGAPTYAPDPGANDEFDPIYTNDPQGLLTALNSHIRLANPQTPQTFASSTILRRSYDFEQISLTGGAPLLGHAFTCYQRELSSYIDMQTRLEDELLVPYISPRGGGYFFAVPGVRDSQDYYASGLLA